jgi:hypothetical protein
LDVTIIVRHTNHNTLVDEASKETITINRNNNNPEERRAKTEILKPEELLVRTTTITTMNKSSMKTPMVH